MIVDFHTHVFHDEVIFRRAEFAARDEWFGLLNTEGRARLATAEGLVRSMDASGVDVSVVLSFGWRDHGLCVEQNDYVLEAARKHPGRLVPFCTVQPNAGAAAAAEVERCVRLGCRGIGELFPDGQRFAIDDEREMAPLLEACRAHDLVLLVHASEPVGHDYPGKGQTTPDRIYGLLQLAAGIRLVLAHWGGGFGFYELMPEVRALSSHLYYDTGASAYVYDPHVLSLMARLAPDRILFGSDFPVIRQRRMLEYTRSAGLEEATLAAVLGGNAARLLPIKNEEVDSHPSLVQ